MKLVRKMGYAFSKIKDLVGQKMTFDKIRNDSLLYMYAGDVPPMKEYEKFIGLSISQHNKNHISHNVTKAHDLKDQSVDLYQSEDVFEHIPLSELPKVINDIYRILKPGAVFRLCLPDYGCDLLNLRCVKDARGTIIFDPEGGGEFVDGKVVKGGHLWFPRYTIVRDLLSQTNFKNFKFYHYYDEAGQAVTNPIDYSISYVKRTPDHDERVKHPYRPLSIVVDCVK